MIVRRAGGDIRLEGAVVAEVGEGLRRAPGEDEIDARGGEVLPGLHDHHVHLRALAAAAGSVQAGPPQVGDAEHLARTLREASRRAAPGTWVRAIGFHESVAGDLDRHALDRMGLSGPVRVQHRSGSLWVLNSAGLDALGVERGAPPGVERGRDGTPTGRVWREDRWLADRAGRATPDLAAAGVTAAALGITGLTDASAGQDASDVRLLAEAHDDGRLPQRLHLMADVGVKAPGVAGVTLGPVKVLLDDTSLPSLDDLVGIVRAARADGRGVAVHCVTAVQAWLAVTALRDARPAGRSAVDRIEHGAVLSDELVAAILEAGVTVVTQPGFVHARGDQYLTDVEAEEHGDLWRLGSLVRRGVAVAASTDAPLGPFNPWLAIRASVERRTATGAVLCDAERVDPATALRLWLGGAERPGEPRHLRPGSPADLCVLGVPLEEAWTADSPPPVRATIVAGRIVYRGNY